VLAVLPACTILAAAVITGPSALVPMSGARYSVARPIESAQSDQSDEEAEVAPADVERYIAVYKTMQRNHSLSIDQAAAQQSLTVAAFRKLESRIEHDDALRERVRKALRETAEPTPSPQAR